MSGNATGFSPETLIQTSNENTLSYFNLLVQKVIEVKSLNYIKKKTWINKCMYKYTLERVFIGSCFYKNVYYDN